MSFLKKPLDKIKSFKSSGTTTPRSSIDTPESKSSNGSVDNVARKDPKAIEQERKRKSEDKQRRKSANLDKQQEFKRKDEQFLQEGPEELTALYKPLSLNMSKKWTHEDRFDFKNLDSLMEGKTITFRARIHTIRRMSAKFVFLLFRQQTITIQGVLQSAESSGVTSDKITAGMITEQMVRSVEHYPTETIVLVKGTLRRPPQKVKNATVHDLELGIQEIHMVSKLTENVPFTVYDAENITKDQEDSSDDEAGPSSRGSIDSPRQRSSIDSPRPRASIDSPRTSREFSPVRRENGVKSPISAISENGITSPISKRSILTNHHNKRSLPQRMRLNNRVVDLRTASSQGIFRIQAGICNIFRSYLDEQGFMEIHTPKLQGGATESGATVFEVNYFGRPAFLAQSPQLAKQMCIAADFERVYEIGTVFRAEDSNTPRHMTEYTGLDIEMALEEHYHEALNMIDGMFKHLWQGIYDRFSHEIEIISHYYPHEKVLWLEETPRIAFKDGVQMLIDDGWVDEDGNPPSALEDLATAAERRLGALVREKYHTDYYILDKFPASARPFYCMPDPENPEYTNSFDIFMRGQEILTGGQRIHDAKFLEQRMKKVGVNPESMEDYMEGFRWGAPPHAGAGIGLERLLYLFLNLGNIRLASLFPRDPKSFPLKPKVHTLRHEDASTTNPPWESPDYVWTEPGKHDWQPLEKLIANYGDAANTSWLDDRYNVWRHPDTGAAQGWVKQGAHAIIVGQPLCDKAQYAKTVTAFLQYMRDENKELKLIWMIIGPEIEEYLADKYSWRTLSAAAEERVDPRNNPAEKDHDVARKIRHTEKEGVKLLEIPKGTHIPDEFRHKVDARIKDWQANRKGQQVHLTEIRPWVDTEHRRYFYAQGKEEVIHAICVLHQLSPQNGYQVKFSLEFPNAPSGTIEALTLHAIHQLSASEPDVKTVTFGTGASKEMTGGRNLGKHKVRALKKSYEAIEKRLHLTNKSEFRAKLGARDEPVYVAYPHGAMGAGGIRALMAFLESEG